ncbi:hypothetical protein GSI_09169 [Ganoderma sinense ZZ0214-1]|uniref:DUF6533 domain-containing protein n=1 Tax=Ganoderma sinense ZZ0214-1 TaxID=1077348 RepID=A0A2G8S5T1_9APHY|nr:hypothetical protein GSI_09169 [Ganoderma sinense ZZ0214-1]
MSTENSPIVQFYELSVVSDYMGFVGITLLALDWVLNFDREVAMFWKRPKSLAPLLYFANSCNDLMLAAYAFACIQYLPVAFFSAMRAHGLGKNIVLSALILLLSLVPLGTNLAAYGAGIQGDIVPLIGCLQSESFPQEVYIPILPAFNIAVNTNLMLQLISPRTIRLGPDDPLYTAASGVGGQEGSLNFAHVLGSLGAIIDPNAVGEDFAIGEDE